MSDHDNRWGDDSDFADDLPDSYEESKPKLDMDEVSDTVGKIVATIITTILFAGVGLLIAVGLIWLIVTIARFLF